MTDLKHPPFELVVSGITKTFERKTLWRNLSFTVASGAMTAVTGVSGSGKTTLLNCIGLLEGFDDGDISYLDYSFTAGSQPNRRTCFRDVLGFLFQNYGLVESWSVRHNLLIPLKNRPGGKNDRIKTIENVLARVGMSGTENVKIYTLSGGEQQRIAMARLILKSPSLILADEPTSSLDHANADLIMNILSEQADHGALVLISTHSDHLISQCSHAISLTTTPTETHIKTS